METYCLTLRFALALLLLTISVHPASGKVEMLDENNGLAGNRVTAITKDRRGLMWIGTQYGLNMYDGYQFICPYPELSNLNITRLAYDERYNRLWVGTRKGLYLVDEDGQPVRRIGPDTGWSSDLVTALIVLPDGQACVAYNNGMIAMAQSTGDISVMAVLPVQGRRLFWARDLAKGPGNSVFFSTYDTGRIYRMDINTRRIVPFPVAHAGLQAGFVFCYGDTLILGSGDDGVHFFSASDGHPLTVNPPLQIKKGEPVIQVFQKDGMLALITGSTAHPTLLQSFVPGRTDRSSTTMLPFFTQGGLLCLYTDDEGISWIGTNRGIWKVLPERQVFERMLYNHVQPATMRGIIEDKARDIYAGGINGLYHYDRKTRTWTNYPIRIREVTMGLFGLLDADDYIYFTSYGIPLGRFDKRKRRVDVAFCRRNAAQGLPGGFSLYRDPDGLIWIGCHPRLIVYDPATGQFRQHRQDAFDIGGSAVRQIRGGQDPDIMWVATDNGLYQVHRRKGILLHLHKKSTPALSNNDVCFVDEDEDGTLWLGTNGGGINRISSDLKQIRYITRGSHGLSHDVVYSILKQDNGNRWISTYNGLSCYDPEQETCTNYYAADGLCHNEFNNGSFLKSGDGKMYFGGVNGLTAFFPSRVPRKGAAPFRLFVSPISEWNRETNTFSAAGDFSGQGEKVVMDGPGAVRVFNLGLTDYSDPMSNSFAYRIRGLLNDWIPIEGPPVLRLTGIPYGRYTVEVRAMNARGTAAANRLHFDLVVKRPFYQTWPFYLFLFVLASVLLIVFFLIKYRNLKKMQEMKLKIASNLHDEVGGLLAGIAMFSDNLISEDSTETERRSQLIKISELSKTAAMSMSDVLWAIDVRNDFPDNLAARIREYAEELLLPLNIALQMDAAADNHRQKMPSDLRQQLYLIAKESVNNIVKHARATAVQIVYQYHSPSSFLFRISNDGVTNGAVRATGQGLKNIRMRAARAGAEVHLDSANGTFVLTVHK